MHTEWIYFFATSAGTAGSLIGLLFVGVSVNLSKILSSRTLPFRALISITFLFNILIKALFFLIPEQRQINLGIETGITTLLVFFSIELMEICILKRIETKLKKKQIISFLLAQIALIPFIICSISILLNETYAVYWIVPGIILSFFKSLVDAWVLLIEVNR